jgi:hypothetical protein
VAIGNNVKQCQAFVAGSLPPLGESYSTDGGRQAAELAQPVYAQVHLK